MTEILDFFFHSNLSRINRVPLITMKIRTVRHFNIRNTHINYIKLHFKFPFRIRVIYFYKNYKISKKNTVTLLQWS